jgi:hypothetical protein
MDFDDWFDDGVCVIDGDGSSTALHVAVQRGDGEKVRALLTSPDVVAMIGYTDSMAQTALGYARADGRHDLSDMLLRAGADVDLDLHLPRLCHAAMLGNVRYLEELLSAGEHVNITDAAGQTALFWAVRGGYSDIVRMLLSVTGVDIEAQDQMSRTALMVRCSPVTYSNSACLTMILEESNPIGNMAFVHRALRCDVFGDIEALMNSCHGYLDLRGKMLEDTDVQVVATNLPRTISVVDMRYNPTLTHAILPALLEAIQYCPRLCSIRVAGVSEVSGSYLPDIQERLNIALIQNREKYIRGLVGFVSQVRLGWAPSSDLDFARRCASEYKDQVTYTGPGQYERALTLITCAMDCI